ASYDWDGTSCTDQGGYLYIEDLDASGFRQLQFDGPGYWTVYTGLRSHDLALSNGAEVFVEFPAGLRDADRSRVRSAEVLADLASTNCEYRVCLTGNLTGAAGTTLDAYQVDLAGSFTGALAAEIGQLTLHGVNQVYSPAAAPN